MLKLFLAALAIGTLAATNLQAEVPKSDLLQALGACFGRFNQYHFSSWVSFGDLDKAAERVNSSDMQIYVDPDFLSDIDAQASYVDYSMAGLQYFNDLVLADQPSNIPCNTLWHEVMHSIYDAHDDDDSFLTSNDELYTWYMEGRMALLEKYLVPFEEELDRGADCDAQELERLWRHVEIQSDTLMDYSGFGEPSAAQIEQIRQLTGFSVPDMATLRQHYQDSGLIDACGKQGSASGSVRSSRLFLMDNSGSMSYGKIEAAIESANNAVGALSSSTEVGVQFFGVAGCDVEIAQPFTLDHDRAHSAIGQAQATGDTPLAMSIREGAAYMRANAGSGNMVMILLSDGEETCGGDPIAEAANINAASLQQPLDLQGLAFSLGYASPPALRSGRITLHVVGFDIAPGSSSEAMLMEIATAGGGNYFAAADQAELTDALITASEDSAGLLGGIGAVAVPAVLLCLGSIGAGMMLLGGALALRNRSRARTRS